MSTVQTKGRKNAKFEVYPMFLGFFSRVHKNGRWSFRANWGRIFALLVFLGLLAWVAFSSMIYFVFKYSRGFEDITVYDAAVAPFDMEAHRRKVGNYNINSALADFKSGQITDFSKTFGNLVMGVTRAPENIEGRLQLARIYVAMGRPDIAIEKLEQGILFGKENLDFVRLYVRLLLDRMEDAKIVAVGEKLLDPNDPYKTESPQIRAYLAMSLSSVYAMHGDYTKSEKYLKDYKLEKTLPGILRISKNKWEMGKRDEAIQIIADNFQFPENKDPMYALLVNYYTAMNDFETARRYCVLRQSEDPFSPMPKLELIKLLGKSGDTENQNKMIDDYFSQNKRNNTAMIHLANLAADKGDTKLMRKIYENSIKEGFPAGTYCLLLLESMITSGNYKQAVDFSEEILKGKPSWTKQYDDVFSAIRSIAYFATGNSNMSNVLLSEILKRSKVSPKVLVATARRFDSLGAPLIANKILDDAVNKYPRHQMALIRLVQNEIAIGDSSNLDRHVLNLLKMRRPPRNLITDVFNSLSSDKFIFVKNRGKILDEIELLKNNNSTGFSDVIEETETSESMLDI